MEDEEEEDAVEGDQSEEDSKDEDPDALRSVSTTLSTCQDELEHRQQM